MEWRSSRFRCYLEEGIYCHDNQICNGLDGGDCRDGTIVVVVVSEDMEVEVVVVGVGC